MHILRKQASNTAKQFDKRYIILEFGAVRRFAKLVKVDLKHPEK